MQSLHFPVGNVNSAHDHFFIKFFKQKYTVQLFSKITAIYFPPP